VADFLGTSQWKWSSAGDGNRDYSRDGATRLFVSNSTQPLEDYIPSAQNGLPQTDFTHGLRLFAESRGYQVETNYTQRIDTYVPPGGGTYLSGFSFYDYMDEIDAGHPVILQLVNHVTLGVGYDMDSETVYMHDGYGDYLAQMTWGGTYMGNEMGAVTVLQLTANPQTLVWTGAIDNRWDIVQTANWSAGGAARKYSEGAPVVFDDTGAHTLPINLTATVHPASVLVSNEAGNILLAGPGSIAGPCGLTKNGRGTLTLATRNAYTGDTRINAGTLIVAAPDALGASAVRLGDTTGSSDASLLVSGEFDVDRPITVQDDGSPLSVRTLGGTNTSGAATFSGGVTLKDDLTLTAAPGGTVSLTGPLDDLAGKTLTKIGAGTLVIDGRQEYGPGSVWNIDEGAVFMQTDAGTETTIYLTVNVGGAGTDASVIFGADEHLAMLHIMSAGVATLGAGCHVLVLDSLWIDGFGPPLTHVSLYNTPEPATLLLLAGGGLLLLLRQRRGQ
jgi:autotransporter-associated beta strand protein